MISRAAWRRLVLGGCVVATAGLVASMSAGGGSAASATTPPAGGGYHAIAPARILDTRIGVGATMGAVPAGGTVALHVLGAGGVPASGVSAVALHVTVTAPTAPGYVTVWRAGVARPVASALNFGTAQTIANSVFSTVGTGGVVDLYNGSSGSVQLIADVTGYTDGFGGDGRGAFGTLDPARLFDAPLAAGAPLDLPIVGHGGVPTVNAGFGYAAAVLNLAAVNPASGGYLTVYADNAARPATSNLNLAVGQTRDNLVVAPIGTGGGVKIYNGSLHPVQVVADISGYFSGGLPNSQNQFFVTGPTRVLDTRIGLGAPAVAVAAHSTVVVSMGTGIPLSAAALNLTVTTPNASGYLTAWADGSTRPATSNLNFGVGQTIAGLSFVPVGSNGKVDIYNGSPGTVEIIADEFGLVSGCC
jgi:hypothetical protein